MTKKALIIISASLLTLTALLLAWFHLGFDRSAGWPHSLADLEGQWILNRVRGEFSESPPQSLTFSPGSAAHLMQVSDGSLGAEFELMGLGQLVFAGGARFPPILPEGTADVFTMTHRLPAMPAWDHLTFFPDGMPLGPSEGRRFIEYERE